MQLAELVVPVAAVVLGLTPLRRYLSPSVTWTRRRRCNLSWLVVVGVTI